MIGCSKPTFRASGEAHTTSSSPLHLPVQLLARGHPFSQGGARTPRKRCSRGEASVLHALISTRLYQAGGLAPRRRRAPPMRHRGCALLSTPLGLALCRFRLAALRCVAASCRSSSLPQHLRPRDPIAGSRSRGGTFRIENLLVRFFADKYTPTSSSHRPPVLRRTLFRVRWASSRPRVRLWPVTARFFSPEPTNGERYR